MRWRNMTRTKIGFTRFWNKSTYIFGVVCRFLAWLVWAPFTIAAMKLLLASRLTELEALKAELKDERLQRQTLEELASIKDHAIKEMTEWHTTRMAQLEHEARMFSLRSQSSEVMTDEYR